MDQNFTSNIQKDEPVRNVAQRPMDPVVNELSFLSNVLSFLSNIQPHRALILAEPQIIPTSNNASFDELNCIFSMRSESELATKNPLHSYSG